MALSKTPCPECQGPRHRGAVRCAKCRDRRLSEAASIPGQDPQEKVQVDRERVRAATALSELNLRYKEVLAQLEQKETELSALKYFEQNVRSYTIELEQPGSSSNEGTIVVAASDWHLEERVRASMVSGLNEFDLDIAKKRAEKFFTSTLKLTRLLQAQLHIPNMVLALLGDFITGQIHGAENAETNQLLPNDAIVFAQGLLISGIEFLLNHTTLDFVIPCHSGNHARTTFTTRFSAENGHSLEYLMYLYLAAYFRNEPRLKFQIADGMHSYVDVYGRTLRFHHGHAIKYGGGVGGLFIPANKAVMQWSKARHAELDVFGHFHQLKDGGNFICNGSLIGYNGYAMSIKADYEKPRQMLFLMDQKRGRTCTWPIFVE